MDAIQQEIQVSFRYPVHFTTGVFAAANPLLRDLVARPGTPGASRVLVVLDSGVERAHPHLLDAVHGYFAAHRGSLELAGPVSIMPGGEQAKNDSAQLDRLLEAIHAAALCRHSYLMAVGGGAVLDVAGFAAATAHRGVRLVRVPTTVLAQDDSAVGVKNGINAFGKKNYLGTFAPPFAVVNDFAFLSTLSDRDWRGGLTEAVKAALIRDAAFFDFLEANAAALLASDRAAMEHVIRRSAALHLQHIATGGDPFELGLVPAARFRPLGGAQAGADSPTTGCATARRSESASPSTPRIRISPASSPNARGGGSWILIWRPRPRHLHAGARRPARHPGRPAAVSLRARRSSRSTSAAG